MKPYISDKEFDILQNEYAKIAEAVYQLNSNKINFENSLCEYEYWFLLHPTNRLAVMIRNNNKTRLLLESDLKYESKKLVFIDFDFLARMLTDETLDRIEKLCHEGRYFKGCEAYDFIYEASNKNNQIKIHSIIEQYNFYKEKHVHVEEFNEKEYYKEIYSYLEHLENKIIPMYIKNNERK